MSYMLHHAIIVTSWDGFRMMAAAKKLNEIGLSFLGPSAEAVNGYRTLLVPPDGSKDGWDASEIGNQRRDEFIAWLDSQRYEDGSTPMEWVEVSYGGDDRAAKVERHAWGRKR